MTRDEREEQLIGMSWQSVKAIAESLGIQKPEGGWDESIPLILDAEYPQGEAASEEVAEPKYLYPTEFFKQNGIPYCETCGASHQYGLYGEPVCPIAKKDCDRMTAEV